MRLGLRLRLLGLLSLHWLARLSLRLGYLRTSNSSMGTCCLLSLGRLLRLRLRLRLLSPNLSRRRHARKPVHPALLWSLTLGLLLGLFGLHLTRGSHVGQSVPPALFRRVLFVLAFLLGLVLALSLRLNLGHLRRHAVLPSLQL